MSKVTLAVLNEKLDNIHETMKDMKCEVKANTEFRQKATGIIGFVAFVCTAAGAGLVWVFNKIGGMWGK